MCWIPGTAKSPFGINGMMTTLLTDAKGIKVDAGCGLGTMKRWLTIAPAAICGMDFRRRSLEPE